MKCLERSISSTLESDVSPRRAQVGLVSEGVVTLIHTLGGRRVVITFTDKDEMLTILDLYLELLRKWFQSIERPRELYNCVSITSILVLLWHLKGRLVSLDGLTSMLERFSKARLLILHNNEARLPFKHSLQFNRQLIKLKIEVEDKRKAKIGE
ncbi:hypothetical protein QQP08_015310 [Theobroma cacao]|nr:hypothetical protein QQP08_015310 [Theobroma cacao]